MDEIVADTFPVDEIVADIPITQGIVADIPITQEIVAHIPHSPQVAPPPHSPQVAPLPTAPGLISDPIIIDDTPIPSPPVAPLALLDSLANYTLYFEQNKRMEAEMSPVVSRESVAYSITPSPMYDIPYTPIPMINPTGGRVDHDSVNKDMVLASLIRTYQAMHGLYANPPYSAEPIPNLPPAFVAMRDQRHFEIDTQTFINCASDLRLLMSSKVHHTANPVDNRQFLEQRVIEKPQVEDAIRVLMMRNGLVFNTLYPDDPPRIYANGNIK